MTSLRQNLAYYKWRYIHNFKPWVTYRISRMPLPAESHRLLSELNEKGIAITTQETLLGNDYFDLLDREVLRLEKELAPEIERARECASDVVDREKKYALFLLGTPRLSLDCIFVRFAIQDTILDIANAYFGMYTKLRYYNVWHTFSTQAPPRESQLWHSDGDDKHAFKCFAYLSDVGEGAGPFTYAPETHPKGRIKSHPKKLPGLGGRSSDEEMAKIVPVDAWIKATGRKGTIILADTRGYHKGGLARTDDRIMFDCLFTSQAARRPELFERAPLKSLPSDLKKQFAVTPSDPRFTAEYRKNLAATH